LKFKQLLNVTSQKNKTDYLSVLLAWAPLTAHISNQ